MINNSIIITKYCGKNYNIWSKELNIYNACFLFTCIENVVFIIISIIFSYIIGALRYPDELDEIIQYRKFSKKIYLWLKVICLILTVIFYTLDFTNLYYFHFGSDYNGLINLLIKLFTTLILIYFTYKSYRCYSYKFSCLVILDFSIAFIIVLNILHLNWTFHQFKYNTYFTLDLVDQYLILIFNFIYFTLFNFTFFVEKRHSLYYENFANTSQTNLENLIDLDEDKNFLSKITFFWVNPFLKKALNNQVQKNEDIPYLPFNLICSFNYNKLNNIKQALIIDSNKINFWKCLWKCYKQELFYVSYLKLISDICYLISPIFLKKIIFYIDSKDESLIGAYFVLFMLILMTISSICINLFDFYINNIGIKLRCSVLGFVYRKLFTLKSETLYNNYNNGQLINFASVDTERISSLSENLLQLFSLPTQIIISLILLYNELGLSILASLIFSILLIPINKYITTKVTNLTQETLKLKDERIKITSKLITEIKTIKMNSWDELYQNQITEIRDKEIKLLKQRKYLDSICVYFWAATPILISFLTFCTYVLLGNNLTSSTVFTSLTLLNMLISPLNSFPWVIQGFFQSWVSLMRIQNFLDLENNFDEPKLEIKQKTIKDEENVIIFKNAAFNQKKIKNNFGFLLGPIDLEIKRGQFIGVIGSVGSGKTSFLKAILGEINQCNKNGKIKVSNYDEGIAYVSQQPWIQNNSIKENILFGKNFNYKFYNQILEACDLKNDFKFYEEYDNLMIGDRGLSLSGGQKTRIALARAIYQNFDIYLIDDIFSSLDSQVANHIYENCILKLLRNKTRIVCTHHLEYLKNADLIIELENGCVVQSDRPEKILVKKKLSEPDCDNKYLMNNFEYHNKNDTFDFFKEEMYEGKVKLNVYNIYFKSIGIVLLFVIGISLLIMQFSRVISDYWLSFWIEKQKINIKIDNLYYLIIFLIITVINSVLAIIRSFFYAYGGIKAAKNIHVKLLDCILKMKLNFFNIRPFGQIINRFSSDIFHIDNNLPFTLNIFLASFVGMISSLLVTFLSLPYILFSIIILIYPYHFVLKYYRQASMKLKRIISNTLSPIYSQFSETLDGLIVIKSFQGIKRFILIFEEKLDINNSAQYTLKACTQWLNLRLQFIGISIFFSVSFLAVLLHYFKFSIQTSLIGLAMTYALNVTPILNSVIHTFTQVEIDMISVERIQQYLKNEDKESFNGINTFPKIGLIKFENVCFRYKENLNFALNSISFTIRSKEFIGIVGRTGAGKSSIFQCLFRMYELVEGNIYIDKQNIKNMNLKTLRKSMYVIPQDVFLFDGTIRKNLDPFEKKTDTEIWLAIQECNAKSFILKLGGLNARINDQASNLSCGEKQIISLIRAFLCQVKILCLDEATSSLDILTEKNLYKIMRKAFTHSTILMIAHKPSAVVHCDKIMVINEGRLEEIGTPEKLISDSNSYFYKMWHLHDQNINI